MIRWHKPGAKRYAAAHTTCSSILVGGCLAVLLILAGAGWVCCRSIAAQEIRGAIRFREPSHPAGLAFVLENSPTPRKHLPETMAGGVAAFDYDGDGLTDIFFANGAAMPSLVKDGARYWNRLFRNMGGLRFRDVTAEAGLQGAGYSIAAAAADFDNDGRTDLFVTGVRRNILYHNLG